MADKDQEKDNVQDLVTQCSKLMAERGLSVAFAESATGGCLTYAFSRTDYAGKILKGGIVCYDACIKEEILGIPPEMIETYTPESAEVTREMSRQISSFLQADIGIAVTGLTTEGGSELPGKPVGTMFYSVHLGAKHFLERKKIFTGEPATIIDLTIAQIAKTLLLYFEEEGEEPV